MVSNESDGLFSLLWTPDPPCLIIPLMPVSDIYPVPTLCWVWYVIVLTKLLKLSTLFVWKNIFLYGPQAKRHQSGGKEVAGRNARFNWIIEICRPMKSFIISIFDFCVNNWPCLEKFCPKGFWAILIYYAAIFQIIPLNNRCDWKEVIMCETWSKGNDTECTQHGKKLPVPWLLHRMF